MPTRTGQFSIALRRGWSAWQKDLPALAAWAADAGYEGIDLGRLTAEDLAVVGKAGLRLGSVDLLDMGKLLATDTGERAELVARNVAYVKEAAGLGAKVFFTVLIPQDGARKRGENYALAVESFGPIAQAAADVGAKIVIEGWPGGPNMSALCCTPETYRAFIRDTNPASVGVNYDPSHLIRLGVDHVRFLREFLPYVHHVHAKDTELFPEAAYELGVYQGSAFAAPHGFGEHAWRYTIPGHGQARWTEIFGVLAGHGYRGLVSVELEDENFNGTEHGEKAGLVYSLAFLRGA